MLRHLDNALKQHPQALLAMGTQMQWGFAPALDLLDLLDPNSTQTEDSSTSTNTTTTAAAEGENSNNITETDNNATAARVGMLETEKLNVLTSCQNIGHLFVTLACLRRHLQHSDSQQVTLYVHEVNVHNYARLLCFLHLLFSIDETSDLDEWTYVFLEMLGNIQVRGYTSQYIKTTANKLANMVGADDLLFDEKVDLSQMKSRERDSLEEELIAFKNCSFDFAEYWDKRVRHQLKERYDNKANKFDWDYHMDLNDTIPLLKFKEYRDFRTEGLAFQHVYIDPPKVIMETHDYQEPNPTLVAYMGNKKGSYDADIGTGPFAMFGCDPLNKKIIKPEPNEGGYTLGACICSFQTVRAYLYEWVTGRTWHWEDHLLSRDLPPDEKRPDYNQNPKTKPEKASPRFRIVFCPLDMNLMYKRMVHYGTKIHSAHFGMANVAFTEELVSVLQTGAAVATETLKCVAAISEEQKDEYIKRVDEKAASVGLTFSPKLTGLAHQHQMVEEQDGKKYKEKRVKRMKGQHTLVYNYVAGGNKEG